MEWNMDNALMNLTADEVRAALPQREPFLFANGSAQVIPGERVSSVVSYPAGMSFFAGHFPDAPVTPGIVLLETMAQVGSLMVLTTSEFRGKRGYIVGVCGARFLHPVPPDASVVVQGIVVSCRHGLVKTMMEIWMKDACVASATIDSMFRAVQR
jgi:3-hydroxyacyl-[acyl-carrier-protein] dehydratase